MVRLIAPTHPTWRPLTDSAKKPEILKPNPDPRDKPLEFELSPRELELAERLLGRPYALAGRVLHGQKLARQLGTPTANVQLKRRKAPLQGVFLVSALHQGHRFHGVANIGQRPTVAGDGSPHLEVHLLEFAGDLYGQRLTVEFHHKLRDEQRFASLGALKTAIDADVAAARAYWLGQPLD